MRLRSTLLLLLLAMPGIAPVQAAPSASGFDRLFLQVDDGEVDLLDDRQTRDVLARLESLLPPGDARRARRYRTVVCSYAFREDSDAAIAYSRRGMDEARAAGDTDAQARFAFCRGFAHELNDASAALADYDEGLRLARRAEDPRLLGDGYVYRGGIRSLQGDQARALQDFLAAQAVFDRARLARRSENNLLNIGTAYRRMGLYRQALAYLRESEAFARRLDSQPDLFGALMQQGYAYEEQHQAAPAIRAFEEALALGQRSDRIDRGYARLGLANAWLAAGDGARALDYVAQSRRDLAVGGTAAHEPMLGHVEGLALARLGRHRAAVDAFDRAEPLMRAQDNARYLALLHQARAASEEALGDAPAALRDLRAYAALAERLRAVLDDQQVTLSRMGFDARRRELEKARLDLERRRREQEIRALERERPWRVLVLVLGALLVATLAGLALLQARQSRQLRQLALSDPLTGLPNRRAILQRARRALAESTRDGQPLSLVALDLDHFKQVNDRHGHPTGDAVLAAVAEAFTFALRRHDHLGRSGGEEFLAVLPGTGADEALVVAERLRRALERLDHDPLAPGLRVRTSAGVVTARPDETRIAELLQRADAALYRAKAAGRDRVIAAD